MRVGVVRAPGGGRRAIVRDFYRQSVDIGNGVWLDNDMTTNAANIKPADQIVYRGQVREVLNARTFGGRTDIRLAGITNRYDSICPQFAATDEVEVVR